MESCPTIINTQYNQKRVKKEIFLQVAHYIHAMSKVCDVTYESLFDLCVNPGTLLVAQLRNRIFALGLDLP